MPAKKKKKSAKKTLKKATQKTKLKPARSKATRKKASKKPIKKQTQKISKAKKTASKSKTPAVQNKKKPRPIQTGKQISKSKAPVKEKLDSSSSKTNLTKPQDSPAVIITPPLTVTRPQTAKSDLSPFEDDFDTSRKELEEGYALDEDNGDSVDNDLYGNDETDAFESSDQDYDRGSGGQEEQEDDDYEAIMALSTQPFLDDSSMYDDDE